MPYYLSHYVDDGVSLLGYGGRRCRPRGSEQPGWSAIDLRPDGGATKEGNGLNACLLYLPQHDPSPRLYRVAEDADEVLGQGLLHRLRHRLGIDPLAGRLRTFVADMMIDPPKHAWNAIRPYRGWYEVYLGGLLWRMPLMAGGASYTETWTHANTVRTNADSLDADRTWTKSTNSSLYINTNAARYFGAAGTIFARMETEMDTVNMRVQLTIDSLSPIGAPTGTQLAIAVCTARQTNTAFTTLYYAGTFLSGDSTTTNYHTLVKYLASVETTLGTDNTDYSAGETIGLVCTSSSISMERNGSTNISPVTDSAIDGVVVGGKYSGFFAYVDGVADSNDHVQVDNWSATDLTISRPMFRGS